MMMCPGTVHEGYVAWYPQPRLWGGLHAAVRRIPGAWRVPTARADGSSAGRLVLHRRSLPAVHHDGGDIRPGSIVSDRLRESGHAVDAERVAHSVVDGPETVQTVVTDRLHRTW